jgi:hypothetical protein
VSDQIKNTYKYETHFHTAETSPCGKVTAKQGVELYHRAGYTGIVVTDHYFRGFFDMHFFSSFDRKIDLYLKGYKLALAEGRKLGMDIHLGMEIRFEENDNDYLVYGINEAFLREHKRLYTLTLKQFRELTAGQGIVIVQAHPFRPGLIPASPSLLNGMEIFNGNPRHNSSNHLALQYAQENNLIGLSGSDFHQPQDAARGGILTYEKIPENGFAEWILQRNKFEYLSMI